MAKSHEVLEGHLAGLGDARRPVATLISAVKGIDETPVLLRGCKGVVQLVTHMLLKIVNTPLLHCSVKNRKILDDAWARCSGIQELRQLALHLRGESAFGIDDGT